MRILAVLFSLLLALPATAATVNLVDGGTVNRIDPNDVGEDVFYDLSPVDITGRLTPYTFTINDGLGLGGTLDLAVSAFVGLSNWNFTAYRVTIDGVVTAEDFGVDVTATPDFSIPLDFSVGSMVTILLSNFGSSGEFVQNPVGYTGPEFPFISLFAADLADDTGLGGGSGGSGGGGLVGAEVPLPPAILLGLTAFSLLFGLGRSGRVRRSTA